MTRVFTRQSSWADLPGTVAALAGQVLAVSQEAWGGASTLERQPGVNESGGTAVMVHKERLAGVVVLHLPASGQLQLFVGEHVEESHQVPVVLVALKVVSIPTNLTDHMLQTRVGGEHTVGTRVGMQHSEEVRAGEELCAGGLKQQGKARPGTGLSHTVVPTQLWDGGVRVSLVWRQLIGWLFLCSAVIGYRPTYTLIPAIQLLHLLYGAGPLEGLRSRGSGGTLPSCGSVHVVHVKDPTVAVNTSLPVRW